MKVNIVIPCHNRWELTKQTLDSLFANTPIDLYDLWVIDDVSAEEDRQKMIEYHTTHKFNLILNPENIGPAASRNETCKLITEKGLRGDYLYHSDNDVYFSTNALTNWLQQLVDIYKDLQKQNTGVKLLGASCHPYLQDNYQIQVTPGFGIVGVKDAVSGYSQLMTWDTWDKYGPFSDSNRDAEQKIMGSEDWAFCQDIIKDGFKVASVRPELVVPCGRTNTYGNPATGHETFKQVEGVKVI